MTIEAAARALRERRASSVELTNEALRRVERLNPKLNAFLTVTADSALHRARQADAELAAGQDRGPLHGIPIAHKDLFYTRGVRTTAGSKIYEDFVPDHDAAVVERLDAAGAVSLGKLHMHELAFGITSNNPHYGPVRNPWNPEHIPGGSSGGSGVAVATGMVFAATGSDTGGSIRIPAAFCGVVGLKPTYGRVSRFGALPLAFSLDHMGPLARTVRDAALVFNALAGFDPRDPASSRHPAEDYVPAQGCSIRGLRIGVPEAFFLDRLDSDVESAVRGAIDKAQELGALVQAVRLPDMAALSAVGTVIQLAEVAAVLGPHLGRREQIGTDVRALVDQGLLLSATDYVNAQRLRRQKQLDFLRVWNEVDCLLTPTTAVPAPRIGATTVPVAGRDEEVRAAATRLVRGFNTLGLPALSVPCGLSRGGLPVGLQVVGPAFQEALLLRAGAALEDSGIGISEMRPPLNP
ncbi:MAG: aspartyl/glutamyl-tRNA amidotransferase subunit A [Acidobacteriia bacterium]|nr:aspartyl/glutamyl-tRNA amidotransferase subunit A [Terriglobia bacterium]